MAGTLIFDGACGFCSAAGRAARRILPRDVRVLPWQRADLTTLGLTRGQASEAVWWIEGERREPGHRAVAAALESAGKGWAALGRVVTARGVEPFAARVYAWVSRHRGRLPGGMPACDVPEPLTAGPPIGDHSSVRPQHAHEPARPPPR